VFLDRLRDEITLLSTCYLTPVMPISATERPTGVSRTSKTLSIYRANRGIRTANGPLVPGIPVPHQPEKLTRTLVVSLHATPERLIQVRQNWLLTMGAGSTTLAAGAPSP
jgi:Kinase/pyrophosphorylase